MGGVGVVGVVTGEEGGPGSGERRGGDAMEAGGGQIGSRKLIY